MQVHLQLISWLGEVSWSDGYPFAAPVGQFPPNAWGLWGYGRSRSARAPRWKTPRPTGSWLDYPRYCRSAYRGALDPSDRWHVIGIRVAFSAAPSTP